MYQIVLFSTLLIQCISCYQQPSLKEWLNSHLAVNSEPLAYVIHFENEETLYPNFKSKRSTAEGIETEKQSFVAEFFKRIDTNRHKRNPENGTTGNRFARNNHGITNGPKDLHLKANLKYHHQQRHPNGSISGSYAQMDPSGTLKVTHYVNDEKGFREYPEGSEPGLKNYDHYQPINSPSGNINVVTNSNNGIVSPDTVGLHSNNRRGINPLDGSNLNFVPNIPHPYSVPGQIAGIQGTPILHSAAGSVNQFGPKSPLFDKYYRPSPEEVQRSYEYHRVRSSLDPGSFRPTDMTPIPDIPRDKQPELRSVYSEYQIPYSIRYQDETPSGYYVYNTPVEDSRYYNTPQYAPPLVPLNPGSPVPQPQDLYPRPAPYYVANPYPQTLEPQTPVYMQSYDGQPFIPGSTYSGPYLPNTATFNQPYPTNIPIYNGQLPQNVPTYSHQPPEAIPVYNQPPIPGYGQNVYYASASAPQSTMMTKS